MKALRDLYEWRDKIARESDESCEYVLKNHQLLKIAELLPREIYGILALCNPLSSIVETNVHEILEVVKSARDFTGQLNSITADATKDTSTTVKREEPNKDSQMKSVLENIAHMAVYDPHSEINCAHDFPQDNDDSHMDHQGQDEETVLSLKDILIKPAEAQVVMPENIVAEAVSTLTTLFNKNFQDVSMRKLEEKLDKKLKNMEVKVNKIKVNILD